MAEATIAAGLYCLSSSRCRNSADDYIVFQDSVSVQVASGRTMEGEMIYDIEKIQGVCSASAKRSGDVFEVFVVVEDMSFEPFNAVVQKELALYSEFPQYTFHFDIVPVAELESTPSVNAA